MSALAHDLIAAVRMGGGDLTVEDGRLKIAAPSPLPVDVITGLKAHKAEVVALLAGHAATLAEAARLGAEAYAATPPDFEERAALIQFGANVPRHWAEPFARLNCMACPEAFTSKQWATIINDGGLFLDQWAHEAERLGWTAEEVFGVGRDAPEARHDLKGLVVLINGFEVVALAADKATIRNPKTGNCLSIYRRDDAAGRCLLWELGK